jgi:hypothetical protein
VNWIVYVFNLDLTDEIVVKSIQHIMENVDEITIVLLDRLSSVKSYNYLLSESSIISLNRSKCAMKSGWKMIMKCVDCNIYQAKQIEVIEEIAIKDLFKFESVFYTMIETKEFEINNEIMKG